MLTVRQINKTNDYKELCKWWSGYNWPRIPEAMLPEVGFIVESEGLGLAAGWVYQTDSKVALLEWVLGNPEAPKDGRRAALDSLIEHASQYARNLGFSILFMSASHDGLIKRLETHGFTIGDRGMTNLIKGL